MTDWLVCSDASLTIKLVLPEHDSSLAQALWESWRTQEATVIAPSLWGYEVTSVIRKRAYRDRLPREVETEIFAVVQQLPVRMMRPAGLHWRAWELACYFKLPAAYDAHYLALAEMAGCPFWTADKNLFMTVCDELAWVHWLGDYLASSPVLE